MAELTPYTEEAGRKFGQLLVDAIDEAKRASIKFPAPNYTLTKVAEEAGEVVKAAVHCAEGRGEPREVIVEIRQAIAMLMRLYIEGDAVHGLPPLSEFDHVRND